MDQELTGVLYVLDEPSIGLHQRDNQRLIETLQHLRDIGNTVIVVEHDEDTIRAADYLVDFGPLAGELGGQIIYNGPSKGIVKQSKALPVITSVDANQLSSLSNASQETVTNSRYAAHELTTCATSRFLSLSAP